MKTYSLTDHGIHVPMRHLSDCPGPKVGIFPGYRGDTWVARCNRCAERRAVSEREMTAIRQQLTTPITTEGNR